MKLSIIVAATENNAIGKNNQMLWNLPEDMRFFKNTTWGLPLIMGRKTFEALGSMPLPGRLNIVISRQPGYKTGNPEVQEADSISGAIELARKTDAKEAFIGGGGQIYKDAILLCDKIYLTRVAARLEGDAFFPEIPENIFNLTQSIKVPADDKHAFAMDFQTWTRKKIVIGAFRLGAMYSKSRLALKWLNYFVHASSGRGHGIHSPFIYELVREVLMDHRNYYAYQKIEQVKKKLLQDDRVLTLNDLGARAIADGKNKKKISEIAGKSVSTRKFGRLLFRLAAYYRSKTIIELGSSLGISTAYLASGDLTSNVITLEGSPAIAEIARETFNTLGLTNVKSITGNFENTLTEVISENQPADLVFLDGNHRKKPVLDYFEKFVGKCSPNALIIIHDIHWSQEMEEAWSIIQKHPKVKMSVDIFSAGLIFFRDEFLVKQEFVIRF